MERPEVAEKKRTNLLSVPLDIITDDQLEDRIEAIMASGKRHQVVLLSLWDFMRARSRSAYGVSMRASAMILTSSRLVALGARFLRKEEVHRFMPFDFIIKLLGCLEKRERSVYLIGGRPGHLHTAASNLRGSFPGLRIVGRCAGYFPKPHEENILLAIKKASPSLLLAGRGVPRRERWLIEHRKRFAPGLTMWCGDCLEVFAGTKQRTSRELWAKGLDFVPVLLKKPWRLARGFVYCGFFILLVYYKVRQL